MEPFIADFINNDSVPKFIRYLIVSFLEGSIIFLFIVIGMHCQSLMGKLLFIVLVILFAISYIYLMMKIRNRKR